jgi:hypothetical protein
MVASWPLAGEKKSNPRLSSILKSFKRVVSKNFKTFEKEKFSHYSLTRKIEDRHVISVQILQITHREHYSRLTTKHKKILIFVQQSPTRIWCSFRVCLLGSQSSSSLMLLVDIFVSSSTILSCHSQIFPFIDNYVATPERLCAPSSK